MTNFIILLQNYPVFFIVLAFIFASMIGSFLNVVIHRLPIILKREWFGECVDFLREAKPNLLSKEVLFDDGYPKVYNLLVPSSNCPKCKSNILLWHNIPILGWCMLKGKCFNCKNPISIRYPIVEFITASLIAYLAFHFGPSWQFFWASILTFALVTLTGIDLDEMLLPDQITMPFIWLGLLINYNGIFTTLPNALIGAVVGYMSLWTVFWVFKLLTKKEGMGHGDFKLLAMFGAWLGWQQLPLIILLSSVVALIFGLILMCNKKLASNGAFPYGPYIAIAGWVALIFGTQISTWYLNNYV